MRHDWVLFLISQFAVPLYAQDNKYNHNAKCSLLKDTSNQWISTRSKFPAGIYLAHITSTFPASVENTVQCFAIWNFPKCTDPTKTACIHLLLQEQNQLGEWPLLSQGVYTGMFICCFLHQSTCSYSLWSRSLSSIYSALPSRRHKTPSLHPNPDWCAMTRLPWPIQLWRETKLPQWLGLRKYLNYNGQIGHRPSMDTIKHRGPASEPQKIPLPFRVIRCACGTLIRPMKSGWGTVEERSIHLQNKPLSCAFPHPLSIFPKRATVWPYQANYWHQRQMAVRSEWVEGVECLGGTSGRWIFVVREKKGEGEILLRVEYWWERDWAGALAMVKWCHWWGYCRQLEMTAGTWRQPCLLAQTVSCCSPLTLHKPSELESTKSPEVPFVASTSANGWERNCKRGRLAALRAQKQARKSQSATDYT